MLIKRGDAEILEVVDQEKTEDDDHRKNALYTAMGSSLQKDSNRSNTSTTSTEDKTSQDEDTKES